MNKSLIALAVLGAFAGAASAQSSVTLYGRAEANITNSKPGDAVNNGESTTRMDDGGDFSGIGGSRWGMRGNEDLGNGLNAFFLLEAGIRADTGASSATDKLFSRLAYVGIGSKQLGSIAFGRQESFSRRTNALIDVTTLGELKIDESQGGGSQFATYGQRVDNSIVYESPNFSGFAAQARYSFGEDTTKDVSPTTKDQAGFRVQYISGPISAALAYEVTLDEDNTDDEDKTLTVGGSYNFGLFKLHAGYQKVSDVTVRTRNGAGVVSNPAATAIEDHTAYSLGVSVPLGKATLNAQYINGEDELYNGDKRDFSKYGISVRYALSKRTTVYSALTNRSGDVKDNLTQKRNFTLFGLAHTF